MGGEWWSGGRRRWVAYCFGASPLEADRRVGITVSYGICEHLMEAAHCQVMDGWLPDAQNNVAISSLCRFDFWWVAYGRPKWIQYGVVLYFLVGEWVCMFSFWLVTSVVCICYLFKCLASYIVCTVLSQECKECFLRGRKRERISEQNVFWKGVHTLYIGHTARRMFIDVEGLWEPRGSTALWLACRLPERDFLFLWSSVLKLNCFFFPAVFPSNLQYIPFHDHHNMRSISGGSLPSKQASSCYLYSMEFFSFITALGMFYKGR